MAPGWFVSSGGLYRPKADFFCDVLCVSGPAREAPGGLCSLLRAECARVSARAVFLDFEAGEGFWAEAVPPLLSSGLAVYAPVGSGAGPGARRVCEPDAGADSFLASVSALPAAQGVSLTPLRVKTVIPRSGGAERQEISKEELEREKAACNPGIYRSSGMQADYFTVSRGDRTLFYMFDTPATLQGKAALLASRGYEDVFVPFSALE